ncbi:MAG TPA: ribonucleotide-diphosphate reductase subunit beta [Erysipelothrix sp.]|nr:ribonucleotide-diphosphate reductase subunit beta [Erysipelothrix sp.]
MKTILKRDKSVVAFDQSKITNAIHKAGKETKEFDYAKAQELSDNVQQLIEARDIKLEVENIQDLVEEVLLNSEYKQTAKAYILYREKRHQDRKPDIFKARLTLKPYEYPDLLDYVDAIRESYWIHTEFNYTADIQDFKVNATEVEKNAIKNAMIAIAQVEVAVKTFWGDLYHRMPKSELGSVGYTFAESEVRHHDAYSHLLEVLGLNNEFEKIKDIPELMQRVNYLNRATHTAKSGDDRDYALALLLFSLFIEHVSLFSQFLIIMAFNKHKQMFKGISNAIEATSKEEQIHGLFGIELINIIKDENPEWFDETMAQEVYEACRHSYESESLVIDWIYEKGDLDFMPKETVKEFVKNRLNNSLESVGYERIFEVDEKAVLDTDWFDDEVVATKHVDFLNKRSINYTKRSSSITGDDLF